MRRFSIALAVSLACWSPLSGDTQERDADTLTVVLTGDILLDRGVRRAIGQRGVEHLFSAGVDSVLRGAQVAELMPFCVLFVVLLKNSWDRPLL